MSNLIFAVAKGRVIELYSRVEEEAGSPAGFSVSLYKNQEDGLLLRARRTLAEVVANNPECDFTNYSRKYFDNTHLDPLPEPDDHTPSRFVTFPQVLWEAAGGTTNNTIIGCVISYHPNLSLLSDNEAIPLLAFHLSVTTAGSGVLVQFHETATYTVT